MRSARYRAARDALGWTHAKLAQAIGVTERTRTATRIRRGSRATRLCARQSPRARPDEAPFCHESPRPPNRFRGAIPGNRDSARWM
jgi:hypothetical protein